LLPSPHDLFKLAGGFRHTSLKHYDGSALTVNLLELDFAFLWRDFCASGITSEPPGVGRQVVWALCSASRFQTSRPVQHYIDRLRRRRVVRGCAFPHCCQKPFAVCRYVPSRGPDR
jgi:hypothetical protein